MENPEMLTSLEDALSGWRNRRAKVFGKWMPIYFWLQIVELITAVIGGVVSASGMGDLPGMISRYVMEATQIVILLNMGRQEERFKECAWLNVILLAGAVVMSILGNDIISTFWTLPEWILSLFAVYQFIYGCADNLIAEDAGLSEKWRNLWKWFLGIQLGGIVGSPVLMLVMSFAKSAFVGFILIIVGIGLMIASLALMVIRMVYLYQTAQHFKVQLEKLRL